MKNQYFGDINDYRKYGLLRCLSGQGAMRTAVCWMLTADDDRGDGGRIGYLRNPSKWRAYDPPLFDSLAQCLSRPGNRGVAWAATSGILPRATFYPQLLTDAAAERPHYFKKFLSAARGCDLVFFDPDNGLDVPSTPYGRSGSTSTSTGTSWRTLSRQGIRSWSTSTFPGSSAIPSSRPSRSASSPRRAPSRSSPSVPPTSSSFSRFSHAT